MLKTILLTIARKKYTHYLVPEHILEPLLHRGCIPILLDNPDSCLERIGIVGSMHMHTDLLPLQKELLAF